MEFYLVSNHLEKCNYYPNLVQFNKICVYLETYKRLTPKILKFWIWNRSIVFKVSTERNESEFCLNRANFLQFDNENNIVYDFELKYR